MSEHILIVEDDDSVAASLSRLLRSAGHVCTRMANAEQAIDYLSRHVPRLIISDLNLPGMDGLSFLRWVRADARVHALPIILYTASCDLDQADVFLHAGATAVCSKYKPDELLRLIAEPR